MSRILEDHKQIVDRYYNEMVNENEKDGEVSVSVAQAISTGMIHLDNLQIINILEKILNELRKNND